MTKHLRTIRDAGYKLTRPRQVVLGYLQRQDEPQTAGTIYRRLRETGIDLVSVYRNVELLERLGVVTRGRQGKSATYALADRHHHHIICRSCRRQVCLPCAVSSPQPKGFSNIQHEVRFTGLCANCARAQE